jgi:hypothetical protein
VEQAILGSGITTPLSTFLPTTLLDGWFSAGVANSSIIKVFYLQVFPYKPSAVVFINVKAYKVFYTVLSVSLVCLYLAYFNQSISQIDIAA